MRPCPTPRPSTRTCTKRYDWSSLQLCLIWILTTATRTATSLNPIVINGNRLLDSLTGNEHVVRGITFAPRPNKEAQHFYYFKEEHRHIWERDIPNLQRLGVNTIRLLDVDPTHNHDAFMCALHQAGIYVLVPLTSGCLACSITHDEAPDCYPNSVKRQGQAIIKAFAKYDNVLGFTMGNEANHDIYVPGNNRQWNGHCQKKFLRDMRTYIASCPSIRKVPVGLILSTDSEQDTASLIYNCVSSDPQQDPYENPEWLGLNTNLHCDGTYNDSRQENDLKTLVANFQPVDSAIPVMLTGLSCLSKSIPHEGDNESPLLDQGLRSFDQARWLTDNHDTQDQFAGSFVFEYSMAMQNAVFGSPIPITTLPRQQYGVGYFRPEECDDISLTCHYHPLPLFEHLQNAYHSSTKVGNTSYAQRRSVPENRQSPNRCTANFTSVSSFEWPPDLAADLRCPIYGKESKFKCDVNHDGLRIPKHAHSSMVGSESTWATLLYAISFLSLVSVIYAFVMRFIDKVRERNEEYGGDEPKWITVIVPSVARTADTSDESDESAGLVSTRGWNYYKSHARYNSTDIDSEVREERAFNYYRGGVNHQSIESDMSRESINSELSDESYQNPKASQPRQQKRVP